MSEKTTSAVPAAELELELKALTLFKNISSKCMDLLVGAIVSGDKAGPYENWRARYANWSPGEILAEQGSFASDFHILLKGVVRCSRTEADGSLLDLGYVRQGAEPYWIGEMPALSNQPQYARVEAETPCTTLVIEAPGFKKLYTEKDEDLDPENLNPKFQALIDRVYRDRALSIHLRAAPLFKSLSSRELERIKVRAELVTFSKDEVVAKQDAQADAVYLVRSGIIKCLINDGRGERFHAALCDNSSFGERAFTPGGRWPATYVAMTRTDLVKLPRQLFDEVFGIGPTMETLQAVASQLVDREMGLSMASGKHLVKAADVLVIDLHRCTRCNACVESCVAVHDDGVPRLSKRGLVNAERSEMLTSACYHCRSPDCMLSCNYGAIRRTLQGQIDFIYDACTGCKKCESSCPYGVIRMADSLKPTRVEPGPERKVPEPAGKPAGPAGDSARRSWFQGLLPRLLGRRTDAEAIEDPGKKTGLKAIKCDFCAGLPYEACVYNCPCSAIRRVDPQELDFEHARLD